MPPVVKHLLLAESRAHFEKLHRRYWKRGVVPFLGAGVSVGCELPSWNVLTERVFQKFDPDEEYKELRDDAAIEPIAKLSFARSKLGEHFIEGLRDCLYRDVKFPENIEGVRLRKEMKKLNPTMAAIGELLCSAEGPAYVPNLRVPAVLTTNVDGLLQRFVRRAYRQADGESITRTMERASAGPVGRRIPIYHLHGYLKQKKSDSAEESVDSLVFTERDYLLVYRDSHSMFSYSPLYLMREYPLLFVGAGMTDPNVRRLLAWSQWEIEEGYRQERRPTPDYKLIRHFALMGTKSPKQREFLEKLLDPLGVVPIWYLDRQNLPELICELQKP